MRSPRKGRPPGLAVVLVGNNPASEIYVRNKIKACHDLGIYSESITPPAIHLHRRTAGHRRATERAARYRRHPGAASPAAAGGYQTHPDGRRAGQGCRWFPPCNVGELVAGLPGPRACTPAGIIEMLKRYGIPIAGQARRRGGPQRHRRQARGDAAAARARHRDHLPFENARPPGGLPRGRYPGGGHGPRRHDHRAITSRPGATVIDVGTNRMERSRAGGAHLPRIRPKNWRLSIRRAACWWATSTRSTWRRRRRAYTPVPGGVGPLTIAMLMVNTVASAERRAGVC